MPSTVQIFEPLFTVSFKKYPSEISLFALFFVCETSVIANIVSLSPPEFNIISASTTKFSLTFASLGNTVYAPLFPFAAGSA